MAQCVDVVVISGQSVYAPSAATTCTGPLLLTPDEYAQWMANPLNLSAADGFTVSVAILGLWVVAYCTRALIRTLNVADAPGTE